MKYTLRFVVLPLLCSSSFALAKPVGSHTTPERERARCEAGVDLCDRVARDDLNNCNRLGQSNCSSNYYEDINQCTADFNECIDAIGRVNHPLLDAVWGLAENPQAEAY